MLRRVRGRLSLRGVFMHMSAVFCGCEIETCLDRAAAIFHIDGRYNALNKIFPRPIQTFEQRIAVLANLDRTNSNKIPINYMNQTSDLFSP